MKKMLFVSFLSLAVAAPAFAQAGAAANPITMGSKGTSDMVKGYITKAAEQVPEKLYTFKPTPEVRSFGQLFGHIADSNYGICSAAAGEKAPAGNIEQTKTSKADLTKALADSFAYCDKVIAATTDANGSKMMKFAEAGMDMPRLTMLYFNVAHNFEHYGNIVTYMRLNKMVPPSSQGSMGR